MQCHHQLGVHRQGAQNHPSNRQPSMKTLFRRCTPSRRFPRTLAPRSTPFLEMRRYCLKYLRYLFHRSRFELTASLLYFAACRVSQAHNVMDVDTLLCSAAISASQPSSAGCKSATQTSQMACAPVVLDSTRPNATKTASASGPKSTTPPAALDYCDRCACAVWEVPHLLFCLGCNAVKYCSKKCQKLAWRKHKTDCCGQHSKVCALPRDSFA